MPAVAGGAYGGVSAADRQAMRRKQLLEAALELIGTRGWSATSVRAVCSQAGLSSRFFYESFDSIDQIAVALFDGVRPPVFRSISLESLSSSERAGVSF